MDQQDYRQQRPVVNLIMAALGFLDLDSKEKLLMAAIEIVPTVGLWYAIVGRRVRIHPDRTLSLEKLSWLNRGYYLIGEFLVSGHVLAGIHRSIQREGAKRVRKQFTKALITRAQELLVRRFLAGSSRLSAYLNRH